MKPLHVLLVPFPQKLFYFSPFEALIVLFAFPSKRFFNFQPEKKTLVELCREGHDIKSSPGVPNWRFSQAKLESRTYQCLRLKLKDFLLIPL